MKDNQTYFQNKNQNQRAVKILQRGSPPPDEGTESQQNSTQETPDHQVNQAKESNSADENSDDQN